MVSGVLTFNIPLFSSSISISDAKRPAKHLTALRIHCSNSSPEQPFLSIKADSKIKIWVVAEKLKDDGFMRGSAYDFGKATTSLTGKMLPSVPKRVTIVRHGLSTWNEESRVQESSNLSILTETGIKQAESCRNALANIHVDQCFSSPRSRAKSTAEIIWQGKERPLVFLDSLKEAHLFFLEGMKNVDAKARYPKEYTTWREDAANFNVNGLYPVRRLWVTAREAWREILLSPGENFLVVTHKSILRAMICTALGLTPERFRAIDVNNGGICIFSFNKKGEAMIQSLNMTAHMYSDHVYHIEFETSREDESQVC